MVELRGSVLIPFLIHFSGARVDRRTSWSGGRLFRLRQKPSARITKQSDKYKKSNLSSQRSCVGDKPAKNASLQTLDQSCVGATTAGHLQTRRVKSTSSP